VGRSRGSLEIRGAQFGNSCSTAFIVNVLHGECISTGNGSASIGNDFVTGHCCSMSRIWPLTLSYVWFCSGSKYLVTHLNRNWCDNLGSIYVLLKKIRPIETSCDAMLRKLQIACAVKTNNSLMEDRHETLFTIVVKEHVPIVSLDPYGATNLS